MTQQMAQELADLELLDVLAVEPAIQSQTVTGGTNRQRRNGGYLVVLVAVADEGGLPARAPGAADWRNQKVPRFVNKGDMGTQPRRVFFMRGQSCCFHSPIAASSRCVARFSGF